MKKVALGIISILASAFAFGACTALPLPGMGGAGSSVSDEVIPESSIPSSDSEKEETEAPKVYLYNKFTPKETSLFQQYVGEVIPFLANDEYYVKGYTSETDYENGLCFYTIGNTQMEFQVYRTSYADYNYIGTSQGEDGYLWYYYEKGGVLVCLCHYQKDGKEYSVAYARFRGIEDDGVDRPADSAGGENPEGGETEVPDAYLYNAFTTEEVALFNTYVGEVLPFCPTNEYYVEGYNTETDYENGLCFYAIGNTANEFALYRALYSDYTFTDTYEDEVGDIWYTYVKGDVTVDMCFYYDEGENWLVVYVTSSDMSGETPDDGGNGGETPDDDNDDDIVDDGTGTRVVDFTKATNVKNVRREKSIVYTL